MSRLRMTAGTSHSLCIRQVTARGIIGLLMASTFATGHAFAQQLNVALNQPATQSTDWPGLPASNAVNGNLDGGDISHTNTGDLAPWWEVDLGSEFEIENVLLYNRTSCCGERLYNITVEVFDASSASVFMSAVFNPWDGVDPIPADPGFGPFDFDFTGEPGGSVTGQTVRVNKVGFSGSEWLQLVEVEVMIDFSVAPVVSLTVDRATGGLNLLNNTGLDIDILGYAIKSGVGALDQSGWTTVSGNYDAPANGGDGSIDDDDPWTILTGIDVHTDLSEAELVGGDGGTLADGQNVNLGDSAWIRNTEEDLEMQLLLTDGTIEDVTVAFSGNNGASFQRSDLDFDGDIDTEDWTVYLSGLEVDLSALSPAEAYQKGDLDFDGVNSVLDFGLFKGDYDAANGAGSFDAMAGGVPEPSSVLMMLLGGLGLLWLRHHRSSVCRPLGCLALAVGLAFATEGQAQTLNMALGQPVTQSTDGFGFFGDLAVDGVLTGNSISHTNSDDLAPWLEVDLGTEFSIVEIFNYTRDNCCTPDQPERDYNLTFEIYDAGRTLAYTSAVFNPWDGTGAGATDLGNGAVLMDDLTGQPGGSVTGQFVRVAKSNAVSASEWLSVAELEVMVPLREVPRIGLKVNSATGAVSLVNNFSESFETDFYRITSDGNSLDATGWSSLDDEDFDAIGPGVGQSWDEAAGADAGVLAEAFLLGSSMFAAAANVSLGAAYDTGVDAQDLVFEYRDATNDDFLQGFVEYVRFLEADFDMDGDVDGDDFLAWQGGFGTPSGAEKSDGDYDNDGDVDGDDFLGWQAEFGSGGGVGAVAVPEPGTLGLLGLILAGLAVGFLRRHNPGGPIMNAGKYILPVVAVLLAIAATASATVTNDRLYRLGDDDGVTAGSTVFNSADAAPPANDLLKFTGSPTYVDVGPSGAGRPGAAAGELGVQFDGAVDYLEADRLGLPETSAASTVVGGTVDYTGIANRGFQLWVNPSVAASGEDQHIVMDTLQHGVGINASGNWFMQYASTAHDSGVSVATGEWHHVMVVRPFGPSGGSRMYVDGLAIGAAPGGYDGADENVLSLAANTGDNLDNFAGESNFFTGILDNLEMFVMGTSTDTQTDYGTFNAGQDNAFIANVVADLPVGDVDMNGTLDPVADVDAFVAGWLSQNIVNGIAVGDLVTRGNGDLNIDGLTDLSDAYILHEALVDAGMGGLEGFGFGVPEPASAAIVLVGLVCFAIPRRREVR